MKLGHDIPISASVRPLVASHREILAGGFPVGDHLLDFFLRVRSLIPAGADTVVDFGAGRGRQAEESVGLRLQVRDLRDLNIDIVGLDIDDAVLSNPLVTRAIVLESPTSPFPLADASVDLIFSWAVIEHLSEPEFVLGEAYRVLRPGGWFCAWTPNAHGYVGLTTRLVPNRLHTLAIGKLQPFRGPADVFPTLYRMNSLRAVRTLAESSGFVDRSFTTPSPAGYLGRFPRLAYLIERIDHVLPRMFHSYLEVFLRKPFDSTPELEPG